MAQRQDAGRVLCGAEAHTPKRGFLVHRSAADVQFHEAALGERIAAGWAAHLAREGPRARWVLLPQAVLLAGQEGRAAALEDAVLLARPRGQRPGGSGLVRALVRAGGRRGPLPRGRLQRDDALAAVPRHEDLAAGHAPGGGDGLRLLPVARRRDLRGQEVVPGVRVLPAARSLLRLPPRLLPRDPREGRGQRGESVHRGGDLPVQRPVPCKVLAPVPPPLDEQPPGLGRERRQLLGAPGHHLCDAGGADAERESARGSSVSAVAGARWRQGWFRLAARAPPALLLGFRELGSQQGLRLGGVPAGERQEAREERRGG
mmetsp:Transcript_30961/g.96342  ORF Transcript_30961/g.96342 Transcript_30961/m.96342 type:complete len:317 (-) Transcript_30961:393-1343(-)